MTCAAKKIFNETVSTRARFSAGAIAEKIEEIEEGYLWTVKGGDVRATKVFAISSKDTQIAPQEVIRRWPGGQFVGTIDKMPEGEPRFALALQCTTTVLFEDKVTSIEVAWKQALESSQDVKMWGFYKASGAIDKETAGAKLVLSTISACAVKPKEGKEPGLAKILEAVVSEGATLKSKAKLISMWRVSPHDGANVFAPFGVALVALRKINLSSDKPTEITSNSAT